MNGAAKKPSSANDPGRHRPARFRSLLVPIDLTPGSDRVLGRLSLLPLADDATVTLLHVVPGNLPPRDRHSAVHDASKALASEARHLGKALPRGVSIRPMVSVGGAAKEIGTGAKKVKAELVVMGRGGARALRDAFLGSTASRVLRQARLPVLVVRLPARTAYSRPALALDLDRAALDVVAIMLRVLPAPRPRVEVIHAYDIPYRGLMYPSLSREETDEAKDELQRKATHEVTKLLGTALAKLNIPREEAPSWKMHVRYGSPRLVVEKAMKRADTDLLVLGTRGYSGAAFVFLGSVAGDLLRETTCDVLVVPPAPSRR